MSVRDIKVDIKGECNEQVLVNDGTDIAATCFFNALFREWKMWRKTISHTGTQITFSLPSQKANFILPLNYFSALGNHSYQLPFLLSKNGVNTPVSFSEAVNIIVKADELTTLVDGKKRALFIERVLNSHEFVKYFVNKRNDLEKILKGPLDFPLAEQALLAGHSFHPAGKSREQFADNDIDLYSPELKTQFSLLWLKVDVRFIAGTSLDMSLNERLYRTVAESAPMLLERFTESHWIIPAHPWQWRYLSAIPAIQSLLNSGMLEVLEVTGRKWLPTSSLRALYSEGNSDMLKFSINVRLTNSVRTLSVKECVRGLRLAEVMKDEKVQQWQSKYPKFQVMQEPAWAALKSENGDVIEESLFVFRDNPFINLPEQESVVLATLTQQSPISSSNLIVERIKSVAQNRQISLLEAATLWFKGFCEKVAKPLFSAHSELGLVFLAHQQNIVVMLESGLPVGMYFRDCQGTGFSDLAIREFSHLDKKIIHQGMENHWSDEQIARYFPYYTLINSCFAVVSALASAQLESEEYWSRLLAVSLQNLVHEAKDFLCLSRVLQQKEFECKGNFFCYLHDHNENTLVNPAEIYFKLNNPLFNEVTSA